MASWNSPAVARRWLAYELRRLREGKGLAQRDVGKACGWSGVKVSYLENAQQNVTDDDLDKLLPLYEVPEPERADFYAAAEASRQKGWWERYDEGVVPSYLREFIGFEQGAARILTLEPTIVPGLLQTQDYIWEAIRGDLTRRSDLTMRRIVEVRLARQEVLTRDVDPVELLAVVDESVLRRVVGGPQTMADQLRYLAEMARRPNVRLQVFPFERGISPGLATASHRILHFDSGEPLVYMEAREGAQWIDDPAAVDKHDVAFEEVARVALTPAESEVMIEDAAAAFAARA